MHCFQNRKKLVNPEVELVVLTTLCNSNNDDGVADRHLDQEEDGGAGVLGERGQVHTG